MNNMIMVLETSAPPQGSGAGTAGGSGMARVESSRYYETGSQIAEERRDDELGRFLFEKKKSGRFVAAPPTGVVASFTSHFLLQSCQPQAKSRCLFIPDIRLESNTQKRQGKMTKYLLPVGTFPQIRVHILIVKCF
jgi:hypothetical protein